MNSRESLSILEALENLNTIVDADSLDEIEVTENAQLISHKEKENQELDVYWLGASRDELTAEAIKSTFRTVLSYLQSSYAKMKDRGDSKRLVEGINTIMVLVGEATQKLERFGTLFKERITDFEEYRALQNFYRNRVIKESYREFSSVPVASFEGPMIEKDREGKTDEELWEEEIQELIHQQEVEGPVGGIHLLNDLEVINRDHLYELFYIKNEGGHPFYTYQLARNMKLACDFGEYALEYFGDDPLLQIKNWQDKSFHLLAKKILSSSKKKIDKFYEHALTYKEMDLVMSVHNALMALMLAANPRNMIRQFSLKGCHRYFADFQFFLREALLNREYQKFLHYSPPASQPFFIALLDLIQSLCFEVFSMGADQEEVQHAIKELIARAHPIAKGNLLSDHLKNSYHGLSEALKKHPNGPLFKALDLVREESPIYFDPLIQENIPTKEGIFKLNGEEIEMLRIPCPTFQEFISQAFVVEEFKTYLEACLNQSPAIHHVFINFQDRTSWKEHARSAALEELGKKAEFADVFTVVTLAKDTDFYNQMGSYETLNNAAEFIHQFYDHLSDESTGYAFPVRVKQSLFPDFMNQLLTKIHTVFFKRKVEMTVRERLDFIELAYSFIILKLIEITKPTRLSFISKDSLDVSGTTTIGLCALLGLGHHKSWSEEELNYLNTILFGPTLVVRERAIHHERFERLNDMIRLIEKTPEFLKEFTSLYEKATLQAKSKL